MQVLCSCLDFKWVFKKKKPTNQHPNKQKPKFGKRGFQWTTRRFWNSCHSFPYFRSILYSSLHPLKVRQGCSEQIVKYHLKRSLPGQMFPLYLLQTTNS